MCGRNQIFTHLVSDKGYKFLFCILSFFPFIGLHYTEVTHLLNIVYRELFSAEAQILMINNFYTFLSGLLFNRNFFLKFSLWNVGLNFFFLYI